LKIVWGGFVGRAYYKRARAIFNYLRDERGKVVKFVLEAAKDPNPFLRGVPAILEALQTRKVECRVYDREKFHAKTYITHAKLDVVGSQALVGSSNFTMPGLTKNIEGWHNSKGRAGQCTVSKRRLQGSGQVAA
jgi:HKD family nuclease